MAIYTSQLYNNGGLPVRAVEEGAISSITAKIAIPDGVALLSGDIFRFVRLAPDVQVVRMYLRNSDLDSGGTGLSTTGLGYERTVTDARKAFNATTNPYLSDSVASANPVAYLAAGTLDTALQSASVTAIAPTSLAADGTVDISIILDANATANATTDRTIELTVEFVAPTRNTDGQFSGANVYDYRDNSSGI